MSKRNIKKKQQQGGEKDVLAHNSGKKAIDNGPSNFSPSRQFPGLRDQRDLWMRFYTRPIHVRHDPVTRMESTSTMQLNTER